MNSLVGYGTSSGSDSDGDGDTSGSGYVKGARDEATAVQKTRNFLLESGSASSDCGSGSEPGEEDPEPSSSPLHPLSPPALSAARQATLPAPFLSSRGRNKLPPPPLNACSDSSVFSNPFKAQAEQKLSALQKHVPLTMQAKPSQIGGKQVCVSYRKDGRCRFGIKCKFAHDSDLQNPATATDAHHHLYSPMSDEVPASEHDEPQTSGSSGAGSQKPTDEDKLGGQQVKKRRVGLSNTLIPPKRAMKQYAMLRDRERVSMS